MTIKTITLEYSDSTLNRTDTEELIRHMLALDVSFTIKVEYTDAYVIFLEDDFKTKIKLDDTLRCNVPPIYLNKEYFYICLEIDGTKSNYLPIILNPSVPPADVFQTIFTKLNKKIDGVTFDENYDLIFTSEEEELFKVRLSEFEKKQDKLVSGSNIKTINGESLLGKGDIVVSGEAVQSNWTEKDETKLSYILNKPTIYSQDETDEEIDDKVDSFTEDLTNKILEID